MSQEQVFDPRCKQTGEGRRAGAAPQPDACKAGGGTACLEARTHGQYHNWDSRVFSGKKNPPLQFASSHYNF